MHGELGQLQRGGTGRQSDLQEANENMLSMQRALQGQLAATDAHMQALIEQVTALTANVVALTKKVTENIFFLTTR